MGFMHPEVLWALLALLPLAALWPFAARLRDRRLRRFAAPETWSVLAANASGRRRFHKGMFLFLALVFSILAAARPWWGQREREVRRRGVDLLVALDVSRSMLAADMEGSRTRLDAAKLAVREILARLPGHRVGLMPFAGEPFLQCPLTTDYGVFLDAMRAADPGIIEVQGTDLGAAISYAVDTFRRSSRGSRALVLFTDGEDHEGRIDKAIAAAKEAGVQVYAVGFGSPQGAPLRNPDGSMMQDANGIKVVTRLDVETLRRVAEETGGAAYMALPGRPFDSTPLVNTLDALQKGELAAQRRIVREERFQWPLALAILFLMLEAAVGERRRIRREDEAAAPATPVEARA
jgi:Ca-activated chloride channel family protein